LIIQTASAPVRKMCQESTLHTQKTQQTILLESIVKANLTTTHPKINAIISTYCQLIYR